MFNPKIHESVSPLGTSWYQWKAGGQGERPALCVFSLSAYFYSFGCSTGLVTVFREIQVNQERGGRVGGQESQESLVSPGKRWCIESKLKSEL